MCLIPGSEADELAHRRIEALTDEILLSDDPGLLYRRGHANKQVGHLNAALEDLTRVIKHPEADFDLLGRAHYFLGVCHRRKGNLVAALQSADLAVEHDPHNASVVSHRGYIRSILDMHDLALADYDEALRLAPDLGVTYAFRGNGWFWQGEYQLALDDYDTLIDEYGDDLSFKAFHDRAAARLMLGNYLGALDDLDQAELRRPNDPWYPLDSRPLGLRAFASLVSGDIERCAIDVAASEQLGTNPVTAVTKALLGAQTGDRSGLLELAASIMQQHIDGPVSGLQVIAGLIDDPTAFLPQLQPLIG
jgi:tetratricopeptide (TPR) repeat protein